MSDKNNPTTTAAQKALDPSKRATATGGPGQPKDLAGDFGTGADGTLATGRPGSGSTGADAQVTTAEPGRRPGEPTKPGDRTFAGDFGTGAGGQLASPQPHPDPAK